jgi:hypothetical protein
MKGTVLRKGKKHIQKQVYLQKEYCSHIFPSASDNVSVVTVEMLPSRRHCLAAHKALYSFICWRVGNKPRTVRTCSEAL